ncbi:response regulator transcription factor [Acidisoma cellulosilytica]|uniref:Response regulator transcription factor n=2 Tax=Acidisoma cellulosilyticum TaxID=2802395 RepID=A0A963Z5H3_9PROT|nr:response regulator transcription factor [Acidisoma cellulosilyticum]
MDHAGRIGDPSISAPVVYVIDDDLAIREALDSLLRSVGLRVSGFGSASAFLSATLADVPSCLILDIRLPEVSGLDFQMRLQGAGIAMPVIFMTGHGDIPMTVRAMKAGALDFLTKPFRDQDMLDAVSRAIEVDKTQRASTRATSQIKELYDTLTLREKEVMTFVTKGLMNKQVAAEMSLSEITVKIHRGSAMRKMSARTLADLVRMAESLGLHSD